VKKVYLSIFFIIFLILPSANADLLNTNREINGQESDYERMPVHAPEHNISPILTVHQKPSPFDELISPMAVYQKPYKYASYGLPNPLANGKSITNPAHYVHKASYQKLHSIHGYNKLVDKRLYFLTHRLKPRFAEWLGRSSRYLPLMLDIIEEKGLPAHIVFLPLIESGFKTSAFSRAQAAGQWQFIAPTAKRYGLRIDQWVDERRDPEKATIAAANYLSDLYEMFNSWNLALAGYNCGENRIAKAISESGTNNFWKLRHLLPQETRNYVPTYIAAAMIAKDPVYYGFKNVKYERPLEFDLVMLGYPMNLKTVAHMVGTSVRMLRKLNPELKTNKTPPDVSHYLLRIPEGKRKTFFDNITRLADNERQKIVRK
jgi:hypothetical protein